ncbi:MAG: DUF736 domain-containing protein [Pseudomonadota bacterium]
MSTIGYVTHNPETNTYKGSLITLSIATGIEILPNKHKLDDRQPDYRIFTDQGFELGAAWRKTGKQSGKEYVSLTFSAPELIRRIFANLVLASGTNDGSYAVIWNPEN